MNDGVGDRRPGLVVISNCITPYRVNLHRLIVAGIPELQLHTTITHGVGDFDWAIDGLADINTVNFSIPGEHPADHPLRRPGVEREKSRRLIEYLKENDARAVIINGYRYLSYLQVMDYCHRNGLPLFVRNDSNIRTERRLFPLTALVKRLTYAWWIKRANAIFSMGAYGDEFFLKYGADPKRLYRVPYWPDFDAYAKVDPVALARFRQKYGLEEDRRYLVFSGRLVQDKRVDLLIDAFSAVAYQHPDWDVLIVGDGALRDKLKARVPEALRHQFIWTGFLESNELALAYHCSDALVLPSEIEPWAVVVQEAMAAGLAVVASDIVGASRELIRDGVGGRIFKSGDQNSLKAALQDVMPLDRIDVLKEQARNALRVYRERVDPVAEIRRALIDVGVLPKLTPQRHERDLTDCSTNG
jgi:glycosyltransferase involved in cell wall biosynthesis